MKNLREMLQNKATSHIDKGSYIPSEEEVKTTRSLSLKDKNEIKEEEYKKASWYSNSSVQTSFHYLTLCVLGLLVWGLLWCAWGQNWRWDGLWFQMAAVPVVAWGAGRALEATTGLPPQLGALLIGIFARHFDILDMRQYTHIDMFLRKVYPVIILGKASLGWDVNYMKNNWRQITALGVLPWSAEVLALAISTHLIIGFPWIWGLLLGSVYASLSCAIVIPPVQKINTTAGGTRNWAQLVCTAGGIDTALSVGVYGLVSTYMFVDSEDIYRYIKVALTMFVGVASGITWGCVAGLLAHSADYYVAELRVLLVLVGGLLGNFISSHIGWGGVGGVAVLACNATASTFWVRGGWKLNNNAASTTYRVLWAACEPTLFAYTGTFFVVNASSSKTLLYGIAILAICLTVRLAVTGLVCFNMSLRERIFICCTWIPKTIVEAVLCPVAINTLTMMSHTELEMGYAEDLLRLIVQAILITTPAGFLLTNYLGPILLRKSQNSENCHDSSNV